MSPGHDTEAIGWHMFLQAVGSVYACYAIAYALWRAFA